MEKNVRLRVLYVMELFVEQMTLLSTSSTSMGTIFSS